jgi:hypothetical protein
MRFSVAVLLAALSPALSGCAAALVPVAAGGLILGTQVDGAREGEPTTSASAAEITAPVLAPQPEKPGTPQAATTPPTGSPVPETGSLVYLPAGTSMPAPGEFGAFVEQVIAEVEADEEPRQSALLVAPEQIAPELSACEAEPSAVLIDLDPAGKLALISGAAPTAPVLAQQLNRLRASDVAVVWISDHPASQAAALRERLNETGLDPAGSDPLLLMRYPGETKQRRRRALSQAFCILAIAGDERADFDDLYSYLRDPARAFPLEPLIGKEWFLIPNPLD